MSSILAQALDLSRDTRIIVNANMLVNHITFQPINANVNVDLVVYDVTADTETAIAAVAMTYMPNVGFYKFPISAISSVLIPEHKFSIRFTEVGATGPDFVDGPLKLRPFNLEEFSVTENRAYNIIGSLPYRIRCQISGGSKSYIEWGLANDDGFANDPLYHAPVFQGGVGNTFAQTPEKVTHRGTILTYDANRYL
jgi:hypothetical protein